MTHTSPLGHGALGEHSWAWPWLQLVWHWVEPLTPPVPCMKLAQHALPVGQLSAVQLTAIPLQALCASQVRVVPPMVPALSQHTSGAEQVCCPQGTGLPVTGPPSETPPLLLPLPPLLPPLLEPEDPPLLPPLPLPLPSDDASSGPVLTVEPPQAATTASALKRQREDLTFMGSSPP